MNYTNPDFLIGAQALQQALAKPNQRLRVFDCTVFLRPDPPRYRVESGAASFADSHIAGAAFLDLTGALSDASSKLGFTLPAPAHLQSALREAGISDDSQVVLYSRGHMMWATRVWWMLHSAGHENVAVLDGGFAAWRSVAGEVASGPAAAVPSGTFTIRHNAARWADKAEVLDAVERGTCRTINALSSEVYAGTAPVHYGRPGTFRAASACPTTTF
ncbi:MAG: sulfurtransferase [Gammaproteobacteria bacterium]|nr:sulfurtransferase [Gammaproteobacteria bacterium]